MGAFDRFCTRLILIYFLNLLLFIYNEYKERIYKALYDKMLKVPMKNNYFEMWLDHGIQPRSSMNIYPSNRKQEIKEYAKNPILEL